MASVAEVVKDLFQTEGGKRHPLKPHELKSHLWRCADILRGSAIDCMTGKTIFCRCLRRWRYSRPYFWRHEPPENICTPCWIKETGWHDYDI